MQYLFLLIAITGEVVGTSALKASAGFTKLYPSLLVVAGYAIAFYFLSLTLKTIPIGIAYAIWSGAGIVLISIAGWVFFNQKIDVWGAVGIGLIIAGVFVVNFLSKTSTH